MLDFCAEKGIVADIEPIAISQIETAYERMHKSDVKCRFVIDMATIDKSAHTQETASATRPLSSG